jgi:hypothetical protein
MGTKSPKSNVAKFGSGSGGFKKIILLLVGFGGILWDVLSRIRLRRGFRRR